MTLKTEYETAINKKLWSRFEALGEKAANLDPVANSFGAITVTEFLPGLDPVLLYANGIDNAYVEAGIEYNMRLGHSSEESLDIVAELVAKEVAEKSLENMEKWKDLKAPVEAIEIERE